MTTSARHALTSVPTGASAGEASTSENSREASGQRMQPPAWLGAAVDGLEGNPRLDLVSSALSPTALKLAEGPTGDALKGRWLGHALHPLLTDIPMGCWLSAGILDLVGGSSSRKAAQRLIATGLLAVPLTAASGMADWSGIEDTGTRRVGAAHAAGNTVVAVFYGLSWNARRKRHHLRGVAWALAGAVLSSASGYLGGHLAFGSDGTVDSSTGPSGDTLVDLTGVTHEEHGMVAGYPTAPDTDTDAWLPHSDREHDTLR